MKNQALGILVCALVAFCWACGGKRSQLRLPEREISVRQTEASGTSQTPANYRELEETRSQLEEARKQVAELEDAQKKNSTNSEAFSKLESQLKTAQEQVEKKEAELKKKDEDYKNSLEKVKSDLLGFSIQYKHSSKCLEVENNSVVDGARMRQMPCNATSSQKFRLVERTSGKWIQNIASGKCLAVFNNGTGNGAVVGQLTCVDNGATLNTLQADSGGFYFIRNAGSNRCVDIEAISQETGAGAQIYDCLNGDSQRVRLLTAIF